jgi:hypothetical protein
VIHPPGTIVGVTAKNRVTLKDPQHYRYVQEDAEGAWFDLYRAAGVDAVRAGLEAAGVDRVLAGRIAWFVRFHADREDDGLSTGTRRNYRRLLRGIGRPPITTDPSDCPPIMSVGPNMQVAA